MTGGHHLKPKIAIYLLSLRNM